MIPPQDPREAEDLQAALMATSQGDTEGLGAMLDAMSLEELRNVADAGFSMAARSVIDRTTPEQRDELIRRLQAEILTLRIQAMQSGQD